MLRSLSLWLTDSRRQAIQAAFASLLTLVVALNFATEDQSALLLVLIAGVLQLAQGVIGLAYLSASDRYEWFNTAGRAVIYAVAAALGPVGVAFQLWHNETSAQIVSIVGVVVTIVSAFVQVVNVQTVPAPALSAAERATVERFEGAPATEWALPFSGLAVAMYAPDGAGWTTITKLPEGRLETLDVLPSLDDFRGLTFDLVLSAVPLTRAILEAVEPCTEASIVQGTRVRYVGLI